MQFLIGLLLEVFGELVLALVGQAIGTAFQGGIGLIGQAAGHAFEAVFGRRRSTARAAVASTSISARVPTLLTATTKFILFALLGAMLGAGSLMAFPESFSRTLDARVTVLIGAPVGRGLAMAVAGAMRRRRGGAARALESFSHGLAFALPMALIRYLWAN